MSVNSLINHVSIKHTGRNMPVHFDLVEVKECAKVIKYKVWDMGRNVFYTGWMWKDASKRAKMCGFGRAA